MTQEDRVILRQFVEALADIGQATAALAHAVVLFETGDKAKAHNRVAEVATHLTELSATGRKLVKALDQ